MSFKKFWVNLRGRSLQRKTSEDLDYVGVSLFLGAHVQGTKCFALMDELKTKFRFQKKLLNSNTNPLMNGSKFT